MVTFLIKLIENLGLSIIFNYIPQEFLWIFVVIILFLFIGLIYFLTRYIKFYIILCTFLIIIMFLYSNYRIRTIINECQYNMKNITEQILELENNSNMISEKVIIQYKDRIKYIKEKENNIKNEINEITKEDDNNCIIPKKFIEIHNKAAELK